MSLFLISLSGFIMLLLGRSLLKGIKSEGFMASSICVSIMSLFYFVIPVLYILFPSYRDDSTLFNILLETNSTIDVAFSSLILVLIIVLFYLVSLQKPSRCGRNICFVDWDLVNIACYRRIALIANICLVFGAVSVLVCIQATGGLSSYLAFGVNMRGVDKDVTMNVDSSLLPLITLSNIILVAPYLYRFLVKSQHKKVKYRYCFYLSLFFAVIYLLYNQGRLPLMLFFVPFILDTKRARRMSLTSLALLAFISVPLLGILDSLFLYFSFNYWEFNSDRSFLQTVLVEFTYPFSNFINKDLLAGTMGYRYGIDYIQWFVLLVPASILKFFGISKANISTIGMANTEAYGKLLGMPIGGGIPTDFLTFNFYQFGYFSLIISIVFFGVLLRKLDNVMRVINGNKVSNILVLRICFLLISLINNFDLAVLFRMRFDLVILIYVIYFIYSESLKNAKKSS